MDDNSEYKPMSIDEIIEYIKTCQKEFTFIVKDKKEINNSNDKYNVRIINHGIEVYDKNIWDKIKNHIPKTITNLSIQSGNYNIEDLKLFPNLNTFNSDIILKPNLDYIHSNTKIKNIFLNGLPFFSKTDTDYMYSDNATIYHDILLQIKDGQIRPYLNIKCDNLNLNNLEKYYELGAFNGVKSITIETNDASLYYVTIERNKVYIKVAAPDMDMASSLYDFFNKKGYNVDRVIISLLSDNKDTDYINYNYDKLDKLSTSTKISVNYATPDLATSGYSEFRGLVESLKWYRNIIKDYPLSPLEKLAFSYDIMKTFTYKESEKNKLNAREPHSIIKIGNIVCSGYTSLLFEIVEGLDPNIKIDRFTCVCPSDEIGGKDEYHSRVIVRIDDDKYNVHGIYALDPTWDSFRRNGKEVLGQDYDALSLYRFFLIPIKDYNEHFPYDSKPEFFDGMMYELNNNLNSESIEKMINKVNSIPKEDYLPQDDRHYFNNLYTGRLLKGLDNTVDKIKAFDSRRISLDELLSLVSNVRLAEGYKKEDLEEELNKIARINGRYFNREEENERKESL